MYSVSMTVFLLAKNHIATRSCSFFFVLADNRCSTSFWFLITKAGNRKTRVFAFVLYVRAYTHAYL